MKWRTDEHHMAHLRQRSRVYPWKTWFAWYPVVNVDGGDRWWLELVDRRLVRYRDERELTWEYRDYTEEYTGM